MMTGRIHRRDRFLKRARSHRILMGILNTTPDSFSDGGQYIATDSAFQHAKHMLCEGAEIIDIGGESTRPGAVPVSEEDERARTVELVRKITDDLQAAVSIDTYKAGTARAAAEAGAVLINDISGLLADADMARTVAETESAVVITYNRGTADEACDIRLDMPAFFETQLQHAAKANIPEAHILLDPGIGFAKTYEQNFDTLAHLDTLKQFSCPILVGTSRKSFIGTLLDRPVDQRLAGTLASHMAALQAGATVLRIHDVAAHADMIGMMNRIERV